MLNFLKNRFPPSKFRQLLIDLDDRIRAEALKAHRMVRDHSGLDGKRSRELEGQARFRMMEKGFHEVCELHGGSLLSGGIIPNTDLKVFQPYLRWEHDNQGIILGLAAIAEPNTLPSKNISRNSAVSINYELSPRLNFNGKEARIGDIFVLLLVARDPQTSGMIFEIALGIIDSGYSNFLLYEPIERFLEEGTAPNVNEGIVQSANAAPVTLRLKKNVSKFVPPEAEDTVAPPRTAMDSKK